MRALSIRSGILLLVVGTYISTLFSIVVGGSMSHPSQELGQAQAVTAVSSGAAEQEQ
jgi:hypothetical protein